MADKRCDKKLVCGLRKEFSDTDLFNQSVPPNLLLVKNFDSNMFPIFSVLCKPDLCEGSFTNGSSELIFPNTALHLWWQCSSLGPIHLTTNEGSFEPSSYSSTTCNCSVNQSLNYYLETLAIQTHKWQALVTSGKKEKKNRREKKETRGYMVVILKKFLENEHRAHSSTVIISVKEMNRGWKNMEKIKWQVGHWSNWTQEITPIEVRT